MLEQVQLPDSMSWVSLEFQKAACDPMFRKRRYKKTGTTIWQCASLRSENECQLLGKVNVDGKDSIFAFQLQAWLSCDLSGNTKARKNQLVFAVSEDGDLLVLDETDKVWMFDHETRSLSLAEPSFATWLEVSDNCFSGVESKSPVPIGLLGTWKAMSSPTLSSKVIDRFPLICIALPSRWRETWKDAVGERVVDGLVSIAEKSPTILNVSIRDTFMTFTWELISNEQLLLIGPDSNCQVFYKKQA